MASVLTLTDLLPEPPGTGIQLGTSGSQVFVANTDSKTAQADPNDPWEIADGADTNGGTVVRFPTQGALYLDLYHVWEVPSGSGVTPDPTTAPIAFVYGLPRKSSPNLSGRKTPYDVQPTKFEDISEFWKLLRDPNPPTGAANDFEIAFDNSPLLEYNRAAKKTFRVSPVRSVYIAGSQEAMVVIETAAAGHTGVSMILGQLVS